MIRRAVPADLPALTRLEQQAFGDSDATCALLFDKFAGPGNIWLDEGTDGPAAMALTVPVTLAGRPGAYLYALATRADLRGTGRMTALLTHLAAGARAQGLAFLCLIPASAQLAAWYARRGFAPAFFRQAYRVPIKRDLLAVAEFDDITVSLLPRLRTRFCPQGAVQLCADSLAAMLTDYYTAGGCTVRSERAYGFFRLRQDALLFDEFFAADAQAAEKLLAAAREKTGRTEACILAADDGLGWYGGGRRVPYAMLQPLAPDFAAPTAYMGLMMDT